jgi:glycosyltransferase involved in cell wall biosynthesis
MTAPPETSVVIPVHNGEAFVGEAVVSVLTQLQAGDELIVVDDASSDGTRDQLARISDSRLSVLDGPGRGVSVARNLGLATARGRFLAFLDHDDLWPAGRHAIMAARLRAEPDMAACFGVVRMRFEPGAVIGPGAEGLDGRHIRELVGSALYRREAVRRVGGFAEDMHLREDADFTFRLLETGAPTELLACDALIYRRHGSNVTNDEAALNRALLDLARRRRLRAQAARA